MIVSCCSGYGISASANIYAQEGSATGAGYIVYCYVSTDIPIIQDQVTEGVSSSGKFLPWNHVKTTLHYRYTNSSNDDVRFVGDTTVGKLSRRTVYFVPPLTTVTDIRLGFIYTFGVDSVVITHTHSAGYRSEQQYSNSRFSIEVSEPPVLPFPIYPGESVFESARDLRIGWDPGALTAKAMSNSQGLSINSLQYMKELPTIARTFKDVFSGLKSLRNFDIKGITSSFLAFKYGTSNTVRDTIEIAKYLDTGRTQAGTHFHASGTGTREGQGYVVTYRDTMSAVAVPSSSCLPSKMVSGLRDADLLPSLENLWDAVPYSFVLDWVLPIGELLSSVDASIDLLRFNFVQCYYSRLTEWSSWNAAWESHTTYFHREPTGTPVNPVGLSSYSKGSSGNHFLEASALVVQRV